ncbi:ankyrin repeat-containing domain protein [Trichoderma novae-zelandiae]
MSSVLPLELLLIVAESLNARDLHAFVRGAPFMAGNLTYTRHLLAAADAGGNHLVHLLARNGEDALLGLLFPDGDIAGSGSNFILRHKQALLTRSANAKGATSLLLAAEGGHMAVVQRILRWPDVDVNHQDHDGCRAVELAAKEGHTEIVSLLLNRPESTLDWNHSRRSNPLCLAVANGHEETVRRMLERHGHQISVNSRAVNGHTPLCHAIVGGCDALIELLAQQPGLDVNLPIDFAATALHLAARHQNETAVKAILAHPSVDPNCQNLYGQTALNEAVYLSGQATVDLLLGDPRTDVNIGNCTGASALVSAVKKGQEWAIRRVLERHDVAADQPDHWGMNALSWAAFLGRAGVVQMLLDREDVDPGVQDEDGLAPLSMATQRGWYQVAAVLLMHPKVDVNAEDNFGWTALAHARNAPIDQSGPLMMLLLTHGATMTLYPEMSINFETLAEAEIALDLVKAMVTDQDLEGYMTRRFGQERTQRAYDNGEMGVRELLFRQTRANDRRISGMFGGFF